MNILSPVLIFLWLVSTCVTCDPVSQAKEFLTTGLTRIFWKNLRPEIRDDISQQCFDSLSHTLRGLQNGVAWSYAFIDASSKLASGALDGSPSSFGDYDQCLSISSRGEQIFHGQYCMARIQIQNNGYDGIWEALRHRYPVFEYVHLNQALCLPSSCSRSEAEHLVNFTLRNYPLQLTEEFLCDTQQSISWTSKFENANTAQLVAMGMLAIVSCLCVLGTLLDVMLWLDDASLLKDFSLVKNIAPLVSDSSSSRLQLIDMMKFGVVYGGIAAHCVSCLESIPSWYTFSRLYTVKSKFQSFWVQPLINEAGLGMVTFIGGFVTYWSSHSAIAKGTFRMGSAIFEKWIRFMPSIMMMVCIDLLWPMHSSGPMFTGIANHLQNKCSGNWWMNFFFISNMLSAPENLFFVGLLVTAVIVKHGRIGVMLCLAIIVFGNMSLIYLTMIHISSPVLIDAEATREKTLNYLDYVHFSTFSHLSNYFIGLLAAYAIETDGLLMKNTKIISIVYNMALGISATIHFAPALHNTFGILPQSLVPFYIVTVKFVYVFYFSMFLFTNVNRWTARNVQKLDAKSPQQEANPFMKTTMKVMELGNRWYFGANDFLNSAPLFRLIIKLSYAIYICNYSYIRSDFFSSRTGMTLSSNTIYSILSRVIYSGVFILSYGLLFQLLFVSPFDSIRRRFRKQHPEKSDASHGAEKIDPTKGL